MNRYKWTTRMIELAKHDPIHQERNAECEELEPAFLQLRAKLSPEEQELLDMYIDACEESRYSLIYTAYRMGQLDVARPGHGATVFHENC